MGRRTPGRLAGINQYLLWIAVYLLFLLLVLGGKCVFPDLG